MSRITLTASTTAVLENLVKNVEILRTDFQAPECVEIVANIHHVTGMAILTVAYRNHILIKAVQQDDSEQPVMQTWVVEYYDLIVNWQAPEDTAQLPTAVVPDKENRLPF